MKKTRAAVDKMVSKFAGPSYMKFQPPQDFDVPQIDEPKSIIARIARFFSPQRVGSSPSPQKTRKSGLTSSSKSFKEQPSNEAKFKGSKLTFLKRLTNEDILIGNQDQVDSICVGGIVRDFIDIEYHWSINIKRAILQVAVDSKKCCIALFPEREMQIFQYHPRTMGQQPLLVGSVRFVSDVRSVEVTKEGSFVVCFAQQVAVYQYEGSGVRVTMQKKYGLPQRNLKLLQVPPPIDNVLNIFFEEQIDQSNLLALWMITLEFGQKEIKFSKPSKIYDIPNSMEKRIKFHNYSRDIYFINLGQRIYALRGGYILDVVEVVTKVGYNHLHYIAHQKLVHISEIKAEVYKLTIDQLANPPKIHLTSIDSLQIPEWKYPMTFFGTIEIMNGNFGIFYQGGQQSGGFKNAEIRYGLAVTHQMKMEDKIVSILPKAIKGIDIANIEEKADMVNKMGLDRKEIYLRLWNNSDKSSIEDFTILLDTLDYATIKQEIENKLKKTSMSYRQVLLIQQGCQSMLQGYVFGTECTKDHIKNYFISHLITRKLQLFRRFAEIEKSKSKDHGEEDGKILINIQNYNFFKNICITTFILQLIQSYCNEDKNQILKIRWILRIFRFPLRTVYQKLLTQIITVTKKKFLKILEAVPQLLPFEPSSTIETDDRTLYQGIWSDFIEVEWQKSFYVETVQTIFNRECLSEVCQSLWFKRHWLDQHDYVNLKREQIQRIHKINQSDYTFFYVLETLFDSISEPEPLRATIDYIQDNYAKLPEHIYGKIYLYRSLFELFKANNKVHKIDIQKIQKFSEFLKLRDYEIFKAMFNYEKIKKGFIMREMKPLYYKLSGPQVFHEGLLNYFASPKSEISDIKYLLNRMNNEKKQFHEQNQSIYEVIVRAMQLKLKLGSTEDIPIEQVIIYIESIPLSANNPVLKDLEIIRTLNEEAARFKKVRLNMSIFQITKNSDKVIAAIIDYEILDKKVKRMREIDAIVNATYTILADILVLGAHIFSETDPEIIIFTYLANLLQQQDMIRSVGVLVNDDWIGKHFQMSQIVVQNLVLYSYKRALSINPSYMQNSAYLKELLGLLPSENTCRRYIEAELAVALSLSTDKIQVTYPLSHGNKYFSSIQLEILIRRLPGQHLIHLEVEALFKQIQSVQLLSSSGQFQEVRLESIYQMVIQQLIACGLLRQVIVIIKKLFGICQGSSFTFIYPALLITRLCNELIEENKLLLLTCSSYLFSSPHQLLSLVEELVTRVSTNEGQRHFLQEKLETFKTANQPYSVNNPVLENLFFDMMKTDKDKQNYYQILKKTARRTMTFHDEFRRPEFFIIFMMLCNDPYVMIKYIYNVKYSISLRTVRCYLSYISQEVIFNKKRTLELGKRIFLIILESVKTNENIQTVIARYKAIPIDQEAELEKILNLNNELQINLKRSFDRMKAKLSFSKVQFEKAKAKNTVDEKQVRIKEALANPSVSQAKNEYHYPDSDDNENPQQKILKSCITKQLRQSSQFDSQFSRAFLLGRKTEAIDLYVSILLQKEQKEQYYKIKKLKDNIYSSLSLDRQLQSLPKAIACLTDHIRNSLRLSRSRDRHQVEKQVILIQDSKGKANLLQVKSNSSEDQNGIILRETSNIKQQSKMNQKTQENKQGEEISPKINQNNFKVDQKKDLLQTEKIQQYPQVKQQKQTDEKIDKPIQQIQCQTQPLQKNIEVSENAPEIALKIKQQIVQAKPIELKPEVKVECGGQIKIDSKMQAQVQVIEVKVLQKSKQIKEPNMNDRQGMLKMIHQMLDGQMESKFQILKQFEQSHHFGSFLVEIVKLVFQTEASFGDILLFLSKLGEAYPLVGINKKYLEIYNKANQLQQKFNLSLPLKKIFIYEGLLIQSQLTDPLFQLLLPLILSHLNEQQLLKMCKVITLAFKKSELEQQVLFSYILQLYRELQCGWEEKKKEMEMLTVKIEAIVSRLPVKYLKKKDTEMMLGMKKGVVRDKMIEIIVRSCRSRRDEDSALYFQQNYLQKMAKTNPET